MKFILHVLTRNKETPWVVHIEEKSIETKNVAVRVPTHTRNEGHTPCANWYIEGECRGYHKIHEGETLVLED